ncbi:hypothetical protein Taro_049175, partial [Colocasia esculenta]|nr:hypothetical protein [Colocasia esculenta]
LVRVTSPWESADRSQGWKLSGSRSAGPHGSVPVTHTGLLCSAAIIHQLVAFMLPSLFLALLDGAARRLFLGAAEKNFAAVPRLPESVSGSLFREATVRTSLVCGKTQFWMEEKKMLGSPAPAGSSLAAVS